VQLLEIYFKTTNDVAMPMRVTMSAPQSDNVFFRPATCYSK